MEKHLGASFRMITHRPIAWADEVRKQPHRCHHCCWMRVGLIIAAGITATSAAATDPVSPERLRGFEVLVGKWTCAGAFAKTGKPIAATVAITLDRVTGSVMVRHDDLPPNDYHSVELWGPANGGFRATIVDPLSGVRELSSPGWRSGGLEWTCYEGGTTKEIFRYSNASARGFTVDWLTIGPDGGRTIGDTIDCHRV